MKIVINGRGLDRAINGIPRYMREILLEMDKYIDRKKYDIEVVVPDGTEVDLCFNNLKVKELNTHFLWDFFEAEKYAKRNDALYINMASKGVLYKNSIATIHDIRVLKERNKRDLKSLKNKIKVKLSYTTAIHNARKIVTVSEFSKKELIEYYNISSSKVSVIGNGWEHLKLAREDLSIFSEYPEIKKGKYNFSLGSIAPHKNFKWIIENKKYYPDEQYVIMGKVDTQIWDDTTDKLENIIYVGFQTDERMIALMKNAKSLVFPSIYEGFGIPPLESIACGVPTVVSDIPVMHEIFGNAVSYINTDKYDTNINEILFTNEKLNQIVLKKYSWKKAAKRWINLIDEIRKEGK